MGKEIRKFVDMLKEEHSGGEKPPGLSWQKFFNEVGAEMSHLGKQGAHELAAALFNGSAFVMYPHAGQGVEDPKHGLPEQAKEVDGREM
jgi:hypothetical protein